VIGVPDSRYGEVCCAYVRLAEGASLTHDEVREQLAGQVARYKIPAHLRVLDELPLTPSGMCRSSNEGAFRCRMSAGSRSAELGEMSRRRWTARSRRSRPADTETALALCKAMRHEWRFLHDVMAESMLGLVTYIQQQQGDDGVAAAWEESLRRGWKRDTGKILEPRQARHRRGAGGDLAANSGSATGEKPGRLHHDRGGRGEIHLRDEPLRFGSAALAERRLQWRGRLRGHRKGPRLVVRPRGLTALLHPLRLHERAAADPLVRPAALPVEAPEDFDHDPCVWYWYKDPAKVPDEYWERYGYDRGEAEPPPRQAARHPPSG